ECPSSFEWHGFGTIRNNKLGSTRRANTAAAPNSCLLFTLKGTESSGLRSNMCLRRDVRFGSKADIGDAKGMSALPPKAGMCDAARNVRFGPIADLPIQRCSILISAGKLHREPHGIAGKPHAWRFSGIREYCPDPRRRLGNAALHLFHSHAQHCWPVQRILGK